MIAMKCIEVEVGALPDGKLTRLVQDGEGIVVLRQGPEITAYIDVCPHAGWRLSEGEMLDVRTVECPGHSWRFDMKTGHCTDVPAYNLTAVKVIMQGDRVSFQW